MMPRLKPIPPHQRSPTLLQRPQHDLLHSHMPNRRVDGEVQEEEAEVGGAHAAGVEREELALEVAGDVGGGFEAEMSTVRGVSLSERWSKIHW